MRNTIKKAVKTLTTISSFIVLLTSFGAIQRGENMLLALVCAIASMFWLWYAAYSAGMLYKFFYGEDEE